MSDSTTTTDAPQPDYQRQLRDMNEALLVSSVRQHDLTEQAQKSEKAAREGEDRYRALYEQIRQTEAALRISEERYRNVVDQVKDYAVFSTDPRGRATTWNQGVQRILNFEEQDFLGVDITETIFTPEDIAAGVPEEELKTAAETGAASNDRWMQRRGGERFYANGVTTALKNQQGRLIGFTKIMRDRTEQKHAETKIAEQAEALAGESRRKDEFLAMLSHELRNPLAPIRTAVYLLRKLERGSEDLVQQQAHEIIERQVANLTKLVSDLLEVSRVISGRIRLCQQVVDMNQVVQHAIETAWPLIEEREHDLALNLSDEPVWVNADATRLEEVIVNLLSNAAKYTPDGGQIVVECERASQEYAQIRVRDSGVGIDKELLPRIFDLFTQADRSLARSAGGLGIGLSLAHRLVDLHGGTIEAHSPPLPLSPHPGPLLATASLRPEGEGVGSEFIVRLALAPAPPDAIESDGPTDETALNTDGLRVLVVDDNIDMVMMLASSLRQKGYSVQSAYTGPDGLKVAQQWRPEVVLLDIGLPGLNGYEVARRLRAEQSMKDARIIALTGYGRDADIALAREAGFDAHLIKPYEFDELEKLIVRR